MNSDRRSISLVKRIGLPGAIVLALLVMLMAPLAVLAQANNGGNRSDLKNFQHVFIIMMENTGYKSLIGNPNAPWINSAAATYGLATNYLASLTPASLTTSRQPPVRPMGSQAIVM